VTINAEISCHVHVPLPQNSRKGYKSFQNAAELKYFRTMVTIQNYVQNKLRKIKLEGMLVTVQLRIFCQAVTHLKPYKV
jgi:hypothetical protein